MRRDAPHFVEDGGTSIGGATKFRENLPDGRHGVGTATHPDTRRAIGLYGAAPRRNRYRAWAATETGPASCHGGRNRTNIDSRTNGRTSTTDAASKPSRPKIVGR